MANGTYPMTKGMLEELRAELEHKIEVERPAMAARLKTAIEMGDLSENAEYLSAKEDQGFLEGRIQELQRTIRGAEIIDESKTNDTHTVRLGSRVTVVEDGEGEAETFRIVGQVEANPLEGRISQDSPVGQALVGCKVGDVVQVQAPAGKMTFKIVEIA
ncbi:MAG: transcription elongation factor GreA [Anaerolineae bacterium]|nr:transcription elongation factor GreA [Anaerolineae bacterium]